jgi:hypothetical protein
MTRNNRLRLLSGVLVAALSIGGGWSAAAAAEEPALWREDVPAAFAAGRDRPMALLFSIPGCGWCERMLADSQGDPELRQALHAVVGIHIHAEQQQELAERLAISGYPSLVLVNRRGQLVRTLTGYLPPADCAAALRTLVLHGDEDGTTALDLTGTAQATINADGPDAVPRLVALLGVGDIDQRSRVRTLLANLPQARDALWQALDHPRLGVRVDAAAVLAEQVGVRSAGYDPLADAPRRRDMIAAWRAAVPPTPVVEDAIP